MIAAASAQAPRPSQPKFIVPRQSGLTRSPGA
jgi:hypothetical protein